MPFLAHPAKIGDGRPPSRIHDEAVKITGRPNASCASCARAAWQPLAFSEQSVHKICDSLKKRPQEGCVSGSYKLWLPKPAVGVWEGSLPAPPGLDIPNGPTATPAGSE